MAKLQGLSIDIGVTISEDTVQRCLTILNMWLTDNPNMTLAIEEDAIPREDGMRHRFVYQREVRKNNE